MLEAQNIQELIVTAIWALPLVTGLVEVIKRAIKGLDSRWLPLVSVVVGSVVGLVVVQASVAGAVVGIVLGLGATGLWEFGKNAVAKSKS